MVYRRFVILTLLLLVNLLVFSQEVEPYLFSDTSVLEVDLQYNFDEIKCDNSKEPNSHSAVLVYGNIWGGKNKLNVELKTRGIFRRNPSNCTQAPLLIKFNSPKTKFTPFEKIQTLKLVLPCLQWPQYEQLLLKEYLIYKLYSVISSFSFSVRLARITRIDRYSNNIDSSFCFFIEPKENLANRLGGSLVERKNIHPNACNHEATTVMSVFQYMIGHTDWSIKALHNITLVELAPAEPPIPIPFDFDFSGFVNSPYALPAEHLPIKSVKERYFNGYCRNVEEYEKVFDIFRNKKCALYSVIDSFIYLNNDEKAEIKKYLDDFFVIINNPQKVKSEFVKGCRTD